MAFVYEKISEEDKQRIDFSKIKAWGREAKPYRWVIDRELDAILIFAGPEREPPYGDWYAFVWKDKVFSVLVKSKNSLKTPDNKRIVPVEISVFVPHGMPTPSPEADAAVVNIKEAIDAEIRGSAIAAGWGHEISEVQIQTK